LLPTYKTGLVIDRIDVQGDYTPENIRWVSTRASALNKEETLYMDTPWGRMTVKEACEKAGINYTTMLYRLSNSIPQEKLFTKPDTRNRFMTS
jgi:hypothetical protein